MLPGDRHWFVDPGQRTSLTAINSVSDNPLDPPEIRKFTTSEYYQLSGFTKLQKKRAADLQENVHVKDILANMPQKKTVNFENFTVPMFNL